MRGLRTVVSAICIIVGALTLVAWAVSAVSVRSVEDGTAVVGIARNALGHEIVQQTVTATLQSEAVQQIEEAGVDLDALGLEERVSALVATIVGSDSFANAVASQAETVQAQFSAQLTDALRDPAPLMFTMDLGTPLAERLSEVEMLDSVTDDLEIDEITFEALDAQTFESVRDVYALMEQINQYGLYVGLALIVIGFAVSPRRAWFLPKLLAVVAGVSLVGWALLYLMGPEGVAAILPGGADGAMGTMMLDVLTDETTPVIMERLLWVGLGSLAGAAVLGLLARAIVRR